jgi:rare lipoprotein A
LVWGRHGHREESRRVCREVGLDPRQGERAVMTGKSGQHATPMRRSWRSIRSLIVIAVAASGLAGCVEGGPLAFLKPTVAVPPSSAGSGGETRIAYNTISPGGGRAMIGEPYRINGRWYYPEDNPEYSEVGMASWYGSDFHGQETANGETFNMAALTAAHPTLPLPSYARVTNLENGRSVVVRINDRGPFAHGRLIDLSRRAADLLGYEHQGVAEVRVDYIGRAPLEGEDEPMLVASYQGPGETIVPGLPSGNAVDTMLASATMPAPSSRPPVMMAAYSPTPAVPIVPTPVRAVAPTPMPTPVLAVAALPPMMPPLPPPAPATNVIAPAAFSTYFDPLASVISASLYAPEDYAFAGAAGAHAAIAAMAAGDSVPLSGVPAPPGPTSR